MAGCINVLLCCKPTSSRLSHTHVQPPSCVVKSEYSLRTVIIDGQNLCFTATTAAAITEHSAAKQQTKPQCVLADSPPFLPRQAARLQGFSSSKHIHPNSAKALRVALAHSWAGTNCCHRQKCPAATPVHVLLCVLSLCGSISNFYRIKFMSNSQCSAHPLVNICRVSQCMSPNKGATKPFVTPNTRPSGPPAGAA